MRIVFFGVEGALSLRALSALDRRHQVVGVVRPATRGASAPARGWGRRMLGAAARALGIRPPGSLQEALRRSRAPLWEARSGDDPAVAERVRAARPDAICLAGYPWLLRGDLLAHPPAPMLNVHGSMLPRHRGPLPLFWVYHADDRHTGVTVHTVTEQADAGPILGQEAYPLPRGFPVERLNFMNAERGASLLARVLDELAAGRARVQPQDASRATPAPWIKAGSRMIDFATWEVERVWHFTAGLFPRFMEPLATADGVAIRVGGVLGYREGEATQPPGTVTPAAHGYDLHCRGGIVRLAR